MKQRIIFSIIMSFILSLLMTCWITLINLGINEHFISHWNYAFWLAWPAAAAISFLFAPTVHKLTRKLM
jgi:hypothetical protein